MSCERYREALLDAAAGALSPALEPHLSECPACRTALAAERALMDRIATELEYGLATEPSPAFLPGARRRITEVRAQREAVRRRWPMPALAALAGVVVAGHFLGEALWAPPPLASPRSVAQGQTESSSHSAEAPPAAGPADPAGAPSAPAAVGQGSIEAVAGRASEAPSPARRARVPAERTTPGSAPEASSTATRRQAAAAPDPPRVFVPPEDARAVRRLALRLRGRAVRAPVLAPETEGTTAGGEAPFDFTLRPFAGQRALVSLDDRLKRGAEPTLDEPPSFDLVVDQAGRET
jgi:hypothetical protein